jgi:phosphoribosylamine--glycine ligase
VTPGRILVLGSGAREHALCWRLATEPGVERVLVAPGNPLMADVADVHAEVALDPAAVISLAQRERVDLVVVGPEAPLVAGMADRLAARGIACFGPSAAAARLEGSKAFAREVCHAAGIQMADGRAFDSVVEATEYVRSLDCPVVVKADGLAAGKGVVICATVTEACEAIAEALHGGRFGAAGHRVVVERMLAGVEASVIAVCDGEVALALPTARDHKRLGNADTGPNTGGMGAYSPIAELSDAELADLVLSIHVPVLREMARRGMPFRGALFAGLMLTAAGPRVLEFNVRFGDPETQSIMPRLAVPLAPTLAAAARGELTLEAIWMNLRLPVIPAENVTAVGLTLAAAGYPDAPRGGDEIRGIREARETGALVFGAGVRADRDRVVTGGGRVLTVVGVGPDREVAAARAYAGAAAIEFEGQQLRTDIGLHAAPARAEAAA